MAHAHILIVEDDQDINEIVATKLRRCGYDCDQAYSGTEAQLVLGQAGVAGVETTTCTVPFNLMVCGLMLPGLSGETLVQTLRAQHVAIPIVVMSAKSEVSDRIDVLRLGADDYLVKPFDLDELVARVEVQLRHHAGSSLPEHTTAVTYGLWSVDRDARTFFVDGRAIELTRTEFDIIATLVGRPKRSLRRLSCLQRYGMNHARLMIIQSRYTFQISAQNCATPARIHISKRYGASALNLRISPTLRVPDPANV